MKKILFICLLFLAGSFTLDKQSLYGQTTTEQAYAVDYLTSLLVEYHKIYFLTAATSMDHGLPGIHGFNSSETTTQGWVFNNFRLTFSAGLQFVLPTINRQSTYNSIRLAREIRTSPKRFDQFIVSALRADTGSPLQTSPLVIPLSVPYASLSFGRLGLGRGRSPIENMIFTIQYGGTLPSLNLDSALSAILGTKYKNTLSVANVSVQYAIHESNLLRFQLLAGFGFSQTRFSGTLDHDNTVTVKVPTNSPYYTNANTEYTLFEADDEPISVTYVNQTLYSLQLGGRGEFNVNRFSIFFQAKLLIKIYEDLHGYSDLNYYILDNTAGDVQIAQVNKSYAHDYPTKASVVPSLLFGISIFKTVNVSFQFSIFQSSSFVSYFSVGASLDVAL